MTLTELAALPRAADASVRALPGRTSGRTMRDWAPLVARRHGTGAVAAIRAELGDSSALLPDTPPPDAWLPAWLQVRVTDLLIERHLGGDALALEDKLREDALGRVSLPVRLAARAMGPAAVLQLAPMFHGRLYDVGALAVEPGGTGARVTANGSELFDNPTWQLLQCFALRLMVEATGRRPQSTGVEATQSGGVRFTIRWT